MRSAYHLDLSKDGHHLLVSGYDKRESKPFVWKMTIPDIKFRSLSSNRLENIKSSEIQITDEQEQRLCVCFLNDGRMVAAWKNTIATYTESSELMKRGRFECQARCMVVKGDGIYIGLSESEVAIFDWKQHSVKAVILGGLTLKDSVFDIDVNKERLFVCSNMGYAVMYDLTSGNQKEIVIKESYRNPHSDFTVPLGLAFSEKNNLLFILWGCGIFWGILTSRRRMVAVYGVPGGYFAASFPVAFGTRRMRIDDDAQRLFLLTNDTGEIYEYDLVSNKRRKCPLYTKGFALDN